VWGRLIDASTAAHDGDIQMIDSTSVRAHQQAATAKRGADQCLGRSRGGLTTKIHVVVDPQGLPIRLGLTPGPTHDGQIAGSRERRPSADRQGQRHPPVTLEKSSVLRRTSVEHGRRINMGVGQVTDMIGAPMLVGIAALITNVASLAAKAQAGLQDVLAGRVTTDSAEPRHASTSTVSPMPRMRPARLANRCRALSRTPATFRLSSTRCWSAYRAWQRA
jgi:transposase